MRFKALLTIALFAAGLTASLAVAHDGRPGKGKGDDASVASSTAAAQEKDKDKDKGKGDKHHGRRCQLKGVLVSLASNSFAMDVKKANDHGRSLVGKQVSIAVDAGTRIKRNEEEAKFSDLAGGDRLKVKVVDCDAAPPLLARKVEARQGAPAPATSTPTSTTPTTTTTTPTPTTTAPPAP